MPVAAWMFDGDARDALGGLHGELQGGAKIRNGRLVLDGSNSFVRTAPLERSLREKTLEAWVSPANLDQAGQFHRRPHHQISAACVEMDTVIADPNRGGNLTRPAGQNQVNGEAGFAGTGGAADQHGALAHPHRGGVHCCG